MAIGAAGRGGRLQFRQERVVRRCFNEQSAGADAGQVLLQRADAAIRDQVVIQLHGRRSIALRGLAGCAQTRQGAIAARCFGGEFGESGFGLGGLVLLGQFRRAIKGRARFGGLFGLEMAVNPPAADAADDQNGDQNDQEGVFLPDLPELLAAQILIDFIK